MNRIQPILEVSTRNDLNEERLKERNEISKMNVIVKDELLIGESTKLLDNFSIDIPIIRPCSTYNNSGNYNLSVKVVKSR